MDFILIVIGAFLLLVGIAGAVIPVLPGPPLCYAGLLLLHFTDRYQFGKGFLILWGVITAVVFLLDQLIPAWGTKQFGGSKSGVWGSIAGLLVGLMFLGPLGVLIGPFVGAVIGELLAGKKSALALKSGIGSLLGFLAGTIIKLVVSGMMGWYFLEKLIH